MISFRRIAAFVTAVILTITAMASYPPVRNFPYTVHSGGTQTWAVEHSDDGVMYFANKNGLLSFDSDTWSLQPVKNGSTVRALFLDRENRRLYAGASEEFGFFDPDSTTGNPVYTCLSDKIGKGHAPFKEIWNIFKVDGTGEIWFQSDNDLFMWDGTKITSYKYPRRITASVAFGGRVYIATAGAGVSVLIDGNEIHPDGNDIIAPTRVVAMLPCGDGLMIVTEYHGIFMLRAGHISQIHTPIDGFLKQNQVFSASCSGNRYAFGTVSGGVAVYNFVSGRTAFANTRTGLQNNTVLTSRFTPDGCLWCVAGNAISVVSYDNSGRVSVDSVSYSPLADKLIPGFDNFNFVNDNRLLISMQDGFFDVNPAAVAEPVKGSAVYFKALRASGDTVLNYVPRLMDSHIILPYSQNSLRFEAVAPEYRGDKQVSYSFMLDNYDSGWSDWSVMPFKEYTPLQEGDYTIRVRARNNFTKEINERVLHFSVLPPWFRSTPAKVVYLILTLILMFLSYKAIRLLSLRASVKVARRKQSELDTMRRQAKEESLLKDYEIAELKGRQLEQDIKHKTAELSNITMNVVRKNEILLDISSRLEKLAGAESTADISRQLTRIQSIIRENINHDDDWRNFMHNFDAAYEDFTKRLQERHPDLTPTELRTCCYLKMGLSSKDIAPLFNISYRCVEMTRYRLRKKLGLSREDNLTEYLQKL